MHNRLAPQRLVARIKMRVAYILASLLLLTTSSVIACGHCIEDKVAAVYDHVIVAKAVREKHVVAFFGIEGPLVVNTVSKQEIQKIMGSIPGVDPNTSRISLETGSISIAFNPTLLSYPTLLDDLDKKLKPKKLSVFPLEVISQMPKSTAISR